MCRAVLLSSKKRRESRNKWGRNANGRKEKKRAPPLSLSYSLTSFRRSTDRFISVPSPIVLFFFFFVFFPILFFFSQIIKFPWLFRGDSSSVSAWKTARSRTPLPLSRRPARRTIFDVCVSFRPRSFVFALHVYVCTYTYAREHSHTHIYILPYIHTPPPQLL